MLDDRFGSFFSRQDQGLRLRFTLVIVDALLEKLRSSPLRILQLEFLCLTRDRTTPIIRAWPAVHTKMFCDIIILRIVIALYVLPRLTLVTKHDVPIVNLETAEAFDGVVFVFLLR